MNKPWRVFLALAVGAAIAVLLLTATPTLTLVPAPPGPADLGPATGLSAAPPGAIVFDLKYRAQTGGSDDIEYRSFWGYGGSTEETKTNAFLQDVRKKAGTLHYVYNYPFSGRKWSAVEYRGRRATALYFDLDGDGRLGENERLEPTRKSPQGYEFITPDFINPLDDSQQTLCRALLQVNFYRGSSEPNSMWSPAALLEGTTIINERPVRLLLYANNPGGRFDRFGSSSYSLLSGERAKISADQYVPRERLSSLIPSDGLPASGATNQFYRVAIEGRRSNGLPARVVLVKDTSPTGTLAVKLASSNAVQAAVSSLDLYGLDDQTVFFRIASSQGKVSLPVGTYSLQNGYASYGGKDSREWEVWFSGGPSATVKAGELCEVALGQPTMKVRAIEERERYNSGATVQTSFKQGTRIYLSPSIIGKGHEAFTRFLRRTSASGERPERPPKVTITAPGGKEVLSATMEYG